MAEEAAKTIAEKAAETIAEEVAEKAAETEEAVAKVAAEVAETEIINVKEAERQRPRRWSRGRDQGLVIVAYALTAKV